MVEWTNEELNALSALMERLDADLRSREKRPAAARHDTEVDLTKV